MKGKNTSSLKVVSSAYMIYTVISILSFIFPIGTPAELIVKLGGNSICAVIATMGFSPVDAHVLLSGIWFIVFSSFLIVAYIILMVKSARIPFFVAVSADAVFMAVWVVTHTIRYGVEGMALSISFAIRVIYVIYFYEQFLKPHHRAE